MRRMFSQDQMSNQRSWNLYLIRTRWEIKCMLSHSCVCHRLKSILNLFDVLCNALEKIREKIMRETPLPIIRENCQSWVWRAISRDAVSKELSRNQLSIFCPRGAHYWDRSLIPTLPSAGGGAHVLVSL